MNDMFYLISSLFARVLLTRIRNNTHTHTHTHTHFPTERVSVASLAAVDAEDEARVDEGEEEVEHEAHEEKLAHLKANEES